MQDAETPDRTREVWGEGGIRAFVSHVATYKEEAAKLKESLEERGIAAFVAHEQIDVSEEWQGEIDYALRTMHLLIAICNPGFNESAWANQETGGSRSVLRRFPSPSARGWIRPDSWASTRQ